MHLYQTDEFALMPGFVGFYDKITFVNNHYHKLRGKKVMAVFREITPTQRKSLAFLKSELSDGLPREVVELQRKAQSKGVPVRSLTFSRKLLKIEVSRNGERGAVVWSLPKEKA